MVGSKLRGITGLIQAANKSNWIGHLIVALQGHYPIYLTLRKL